eukprot:2811981-Amphidinium_carterae.1
MSAKQWDMVPSAAALEYAVVEFSGKQHMVTEAPLDAQLHGYLTYRTLQPVPNATKCSSNASQPHAPELHRIKNAGQSAFSPLQRRKRARVWLL